MQGCSIRPQSSDAGLRASGRSKEKVTRTPHPPQLARCGGLGVREPGRDVEGCAWPKKFGNRCFTGWWAIGWEAGHRVGGGANPAQVDSGPRGIGQYLNLLNAF